MIVRIRPGPVHPRTVPVRWDFQHPAHHHATILLACGAWTLYRTTGITGSRIADFEWRWAKTPEEQLIAFPRRGSPAASSVAESPGSAWPGFRGPDRDGVVRELRIETDWTTSPPVELWRRPIGPGWSSFAARRGFLYTQEQRGDEELVACYDSATGEPVWTHRDTTRFWESGTGAGPRATPTLSGNRLYALGATGLLNALDATDGTVKWSRDVTTDTATEVPLWGFSSSPLVVHDVVIVAAAAGLSATTSSTENCVGLVRRAAGVGEATVHRIC